MSAAAAAENVIAEFNNQSWTIDDIIGVKTDMRISQFHEPVNVSDVLANKYYYAVTNDEPPRLFIIYVKEKTDTTISYQIVNIRVGQDGDDWHRQTGGYLIKVSHRNLPRSTVLFPASGTMRSGLTLYDIPNDNFVTHNSIRIEPSQVKPPTFGYRGGKRKSRRARKATRSRRLKRK